MKENAVKYAMMVGSYLPYSETFIYDQIINQKEFSPVVLAREWNKDRIKFPYNNVIVLSPFERLLYFGLNHSFIFSNVIKKNRLKLIHAHFGTNGALISSIAKKLGLPLAVTFHGVDVGILLNKNIPLKYSFYKRLFKQMFEISNILLPVSDHLAENLIKLGAAPAKIKLHHLGIDISKFKALVRPDRPVRFLMAGRMVEKKGFEYGIRAFANAADKLKESTLTITGNGVLFNSLKLLTAQLNIEKKVIFPGAVSANSMPEIYEQHDILLAPSVIAKNNDMDGSLTVLKEASASAMPSIGTINTGLPELTGTIVKERDVISLADAMITLADNYQLRLDKGNEARRKTEQEYNSVIQNSRLENIFKTLL